MLFLPGVGDHEAGDIEKHASEVVKRLEQTLIKADSLCTGLHVDSRNASTRNLAGFGSRMMAAGLTLQEVVAAMTAASAC